MSTVSQAQPEVKKTVPICASFDNSNGDKSIYQRLRKYTRDKGLGKEQDSIRLAVAKFLEMEGY